MARIIFVPGKNPKPNPVEHKRQLWRCLVAGVRRVNHQLAEQLDERPDCFRLVAWNRRFYGEEARIEDELPWIDRLLRQEHASAEDIQEAESWNKRLTAFSYQVGDWFPPLVRWVADDAARSTIEETHRYFANIDRSADHIHELLHFELDNARRAHEPVLLVGHSLGSVIAYNTLWLLTQHYGGHHPVDTFLSLGSPLGMSFVQKRLLGAAETGRRRYPAEFRHWVNIASVGDITALDATVSDDFEEMKRLDLVEDIIDRHGRIYNWFRDHNGLNPHRSYGYLVNPVVSQSIASWLHRHWDD